MLSQVAQTMHKFVKQCENKQVLNLYNQIEQGKMLRSKLILLIAGQTPQAVELCAVVELIHLSSLLHDDVLDEASTRRGKPTIHILFDTKTAIMLGDVLYSKAFSQLSLIHKDVAYCISSAVTALSIGELLDIELSKSFNTNQELYMDMINKKTASLIEASTKSAAILSNKDRDKFAIYGKSLGLSFQIIDDILDITQNSETLGKPAMSDFKDGKTTLSYMLLYQELSNDDKTKLKSYFKKSLTKDELSWIKNNMTKHDILNKTKQIARQLAQNGLNAIKNEQNKKLFDIINDILNRER
ncbi:MAG: polyprenyl synthetase family protein [Epsilonproteobacteria bacterium]|nr:MAG: polyprenyl synthetase family protein [Campylobacterota bacterium]